jgi:hypothetical protein
LYGNNETCTFATPSPGTWFVGIYTYAAYSGMSLVGDYSLVRTPSKLYTMTPCRIVDTRVSQDPAAVKRGVFADNETRIYPFSTSTDCPGLPADAKGWVVHVSLRPTAKATYLTAYPHGNPRPGASILLGYVGKQIGDNVIIAAGASGAFDLYSQYAADVIIDVSGYFK